MKFQGATTTTPFKLGRSYVLKFRFALALAVLACLFAFLHSSQSHAADWLRFRGGNGSGVGEGARLPMEFGPQTHVRWRTEVPRGKSSPIVIGDKVVLAGSSEDLLLITAYDLNTGEEVWRSGLERTNPAELYKDNDSASSTPVSDGTSIFVFFQELGLAAFDLEGKHLWTHALGPFHSFYGIGASPVVSGDTLIMVCDLQRDSFIVAVDKRDGRERWRVERELHQAGWSTPVLYPGNDEPEFAITQGHGWLDVYRLVDGEHAFAIPGIGNVGPIPSPVLDGDHLLVTVQNETEGSIPFPTYDVLLTRHDADGDGWLTKEELGRHLLVTHFGWIDVDRDGRFNREQYEFAAETMFEPVFGVRLFDVGGLMAGDPPKQVWLHEKKLPKHTTPVAHEGVIYTVTTGGILTSLDAETGVTIKVGRLPDAAGQYFASPVLGDGKLYFANQRGIFSVVAVGGEWEPLATHSLNEFVFATPAIAEDALIVRTEKALYAFADADE